MALIKGKQIQDTSVSLTKLSDAGSVTLNTGTITLGAAARLQISADPVNGNDVVRKAYVDSVATGLDVKKSVDAIYYESGTGTNTFNSGNPLTLNDVDSNIRTGTPLPDLVLDGYAVQNGDRVLIAITTALKAKVSGIYTYNGTALERADDANNDPGAEVSGGMFTFVEQGTVYHDTGWVVSSPNGAVTLAVDGNGWTGQDIIFTQFSYAGVIDAGVGLTRSGTILDVNYDNSSIGINGSDQLYVKANGITNDMILNEYLTFAGDSGTGNIALGSTLTIAGGSNGIDTSYSAGTLTINLDLSELSTVTSIADSDFIAGVTANGATNQKITFADLKSLIGAASQLAVAVEGGSSVSFDLDTDTLNFASGEGLTVTRSASTAGTTDTLTVTVSNNALNVHQVTSLTVAVSGNTDITLSSNAAEVFSVSVNGVMLKKSTNWVWPQGGSANLVRVTGLPYAIETSDEIEITYRVQ